MIRPLAAATALILLSCAPWPAQANWVGVAENDKIRVYASRATLVRQGNLVRMWSLLDYDAAQESEQGTFRSAQTQDEYDCAVRRSRLLIVTRHEGRMGGGKVVHTDRTAGEWEDLPAEGLLPILFRFACRGG